jgi:hypothetical protein
LSYETNRGKIKDEKKQPTEYIMKKLMVAAVVATMASVSMADISIKGDAYLQYADMSTNVK